MSGRRPPPAVSAASRRRRPASRPVPPQPANDDAHHESSVSVIAAQPSSGTPRPARPSRRSARLLLIGAGLGLVHQVDHILRYDHSGWPFRPEVSLFTFSWAFFALGLAPLVMRRPWLRLLPVALVLIGVQAAHIFIETPHDQYSVWASGVSEYPGAQGEPNLLGIVSPIVGVLAAGVAIAVSLCFLGALLSLAVDARRPLRPLPAAHRPP